LCPMKYLCDDNCDDDVETSTSITTSICVVLRNIIYAVERKRLKFFLKDLLGIQIRIWILIIRYSSYYCDYYCYYCCCCCWLLTKITFRLRTSYNVTYTLTFF
jgi:hypothetical protein